MTMTTTPLAPSIAIMVQEPIAELIRRRVVSFVREEQVIKSGTGTAVQPMRVGLMSLNLMPATDNCFFAPQDPHEATILLVMATQPLVTHLKVRGRI